MKYKINHKKNAAQKILIITTFLFFVIALPLFSAQAVSSWVGNSVPPPGSNADWPITAGTSSQTKAGALIVGGIRSTLDGYFDGKVGIGTTTPSSKLTVGGDINFTGNLYKNGTLFSSGTSQWTTNGSNIYYNTGNVGIGTTTPIGLLTVGNGNNVFTVGINDVTTGAWLRNNGFDTVLSTNQGSLFLGYGGNTSKTIHIGNANPGVVQVAGNAPVSTLVIPSSGNVGIGTTNPAADLDVNGSIFAGTASTCCNPVTPTLSLAEQTNSNGRLPTIQFHAAGSQEAYIKLLKNERTFELGDNQNNGVNLRLISNSSDQNGRLEARSVVVDNNNSNNNSNDNSLKFGGSGSGEKIASQRTDGAGQYGLDFYTGNTNRMRIRNDGNIDVSGALSALKLYSSLPIQLKNTATNANSIESYNQNTNFVAYGTSAGTFNIYSEQTPGSGYAYTNGMNVKIYGNLTANNLTQVSDISLKKDISPLAGSLDKIKQLRGVNFTWKANNQKDIGVIAQEVEKVFPEIVKTDKDKNLKSVDYARLVAPLIEAVKDQQSQIDELKKEVEELKKR